MSEKVYDIVIYGASGFTGQFVIEEILREKLNSDNASLRICSAGRNKEKLLEGLKIAAEVCNTSVDDVAVEVADVSNMDELTALASKTKVLLSCVGPYRKFGLPVAKACIAGGADFLDISGEPQYLEEVQATLSESASEKAVHIVGSCGFDSVPADMGALHLQAQFPGDLCYIEMAVGHHSSDGSSASIHATTLECAVLGYANKEKLRQNRSKILGKSLAMPQPKPPARPLVWWNDFCHQWCVANIGADRSVVLRSQHLLNALHDKPPTHFSAYFGMHSLAAALKAVLFGVVFVVMSGFSWSRNWLIKYPEVFSGGMFTWAGPSRAMLQKQSFVMTLVGKGWSSQALDNRPAKPDLVKICTVAGPDPGYYGTALIAVQCALTVLQEKELLPKSGGVFTPGAAFYKTSLIKRLQKKGVSFSVAAFE